MPEDRVREIDTEIGRLRFWGSDCMACGNATPHSMRCDNCGETEYTVAMWIHSIGAEAKYAQAEAAGAT